MVSAGDVVFPNPVSKIMGFKRPYGWLLFVSTPIDLIDSR